MTDIATATPTTPWRRARRQPIKAKHREHSHAYIDGFYVSATIDEFARRWYVSGRLAGMEASLTGIVDGASLSDLERAAAAAVRAGQAAGMTAR